MNPQIIPVAVCGAVAMFSLVVGVARPWRRLGPRVHSYTAGSRARLSGSPPDLIQLGAPPPTATGVLASVFGPIVAAAARRLSAVVGHRDEATLALALDRAGIHNVTPQSYSYQQLAYAVIGLLAGAVAGQLGGTRLAVLMAVGGGTIGALRKRSELDRRTEARRERMKAELETVCHLLAIYARARSNLQGVIEMFCARAHGEVVGELRRVQASIASGTPPEIAFAAAADLTPEPSAASLYRALALAVITGGDLAETLLAQAANQRDAYRDDRKARATRRTLMIVLSNASLMILPLLVLIGGGIPYMVLGSL